MNAFTLHNPWATLVALNEKKNETRSWPTKYRGPLLIHASKSNRPWHMDLAWREPFFSALKPIHADIHGYTGMTYYPGCIIAIGNLINCVQITEQMAYEMEKEDPKEFAFGDYAPGRFAWILSNVYKLKTPIQVKGMQRLWNFDETLHEIAIDPYVCGGGRIWTPKGIRTGQKVDPGKEDAVRGLEVIV